MSVLSDTLTITGKEVLLFLKQPVFGVVRSLVFPLMWIIFFAYGFGGTLHSIPIAIVNDASGAYSQNIVGGIATGNTFAIQFQPYDRALNDFQAGKVLAVVHIPSGFDTKFGTGDAKMYLLLDQTNPSLYATIKAAVEASVLKVSQQVSLVPSPQGAPANLDEEVFFGEGTRYIDYLAPGIIIQTIVFSAMFSGGISLIMDKEFGTLKLLMMAPISRTSIILGKILGGVIQSLISGFVTLFIVILLGAKMEYSLLLVFVVPLTMILISFAFIGLATLIAIRVRAIEQFVLLLQIIIQPLWFVSGGLYPIYSMPDWMQSIAIVNPLTYANDAMRSVMVRSNLLAPIMTDMLFLTAFSLVIVLIGIRSFRRTIE